MAHVSNSNLLEAGIQFGHKPSQWNPKMKSYIYTTKKDTHIFDLYKVSKAIDASYEQMQKMAKKGDILFVGTKKQASENVKEQAKRAGAFYVNHRWLGGMLTNFKEIKNRIHKLTLLEKEKESGLFDQLTKKEQSLKNKELKKLDDTLGGIREMKKLPAAIFVCDTVHDRNAIIEARKLNIPVFALVDTNADPDLVDFIIPGNDDAIRAVKLILTAMANAIVATKGGKVINLSKETKRVDKNEATNEKE